MRRRTRPIITDAQAEVIMVIRSTHYQPGDVVHLGWLFPGRDAQSNGLRRAFGSLVRRGLIRELERCPGTGLGIKRDADAHPAAVDAASFARVQRLLDGRLRPITYPKQIEPVHLLPGLLSCGYCDTAVVVDQGAFICNRHRKRAAACPHALRTPIRQLEDVVLAAVSQRILTGGGMQPLLEAVNTALWQSGDQSREELVQAERRLERVTAAIGKLLDALEDGGGSTIAARLAAREREAEELRSQIAELRANTADARRAGIGRAELIRLLEDLQAVLEIGTPAERRAVLSGLLVGVKVWADQLEIVYRLPAPPITGGSLDNRGTPSGASSHASCAVRARFHWNSHRNFSRGSARQLRSQRVNARGEIKLFGKQLYLTRALAGAEVLVRLNDGLATIYHAETVLRRRVNVG